jgi:serine/threonine-protein kinase
VSTQPPPPPSDDSWPTREEVVVDAPPPGDTAEHPAVGPPLPPDEPDRRIGKGLLAGIALVALAAAAIAAGWFLTRDDDSSATTTSARTVTVRTSTVAATVAVPRLVGLNEKDALVRLGEAGLRPKEVYKPTKKPTNVVVSQKPVEGGNLKRGAQVTLVIDSGAPRVAVPDLGGLAAADAVKRLDALGLDSRQTTVSSTERAGTVVDQTPAAGGQLAKGSVVTISVAKAAPVDVPDVVGSSRADAQTTLEGAGFEVNAVTVPSADPKDQVVAQRPAAGEQAEKGSRVRINVSDGSGGTSTGTSTGTTTAKADTTPAPVTATVPDLAGMDLQAAANSLAKANLLAGVQYVPSQDPLGSVVAQSPKAGETTSARSHVTVNVSSGPGAKAQKTVPDATGQTLDQAVRTMNGAGLRLVFTKIAVTRRDEAGKVVEQSPRVGRTAPQNAQVLVYIAAFRG